MEESIRHGDTVMDAYHPQTWQPIVAQSQDPCQNYQGSPPQGEVLKIDGLAPQRDKWNEMGMSHRAAGPTGGHYW